MSSQFPQDFNINKLNIISADGKAVNVKFLMLELNIYEDIWSSTVSGNILLSDALNLPMNLPIFAFEDIEIEFEQPGKTPFAKTFRVYRVGERKLWKERQMVYTLYFASKERFKDKLKKVSKSYKGKLISDIVSDIHYNFLNGGSIRIKPTKFLHHIIIPNMHPTAAINWLATRANAAEYNGANYLYYEDRNQFNFVPMEENLESPSMRSLIFQMANIREPSIAYHPRDIESDIRAGQGYNFEEQSEVIGPQALGMYGSELLTHDMVRKKWERYTFSYPDDFDRFKHLYPGNMLYSKTKMDLHSKDNRFKFHSSVDIGRDYPFMEKKWVRERTTQIPQLNCTKFAITVPGDSELTVGKVVEFKMPSPESPIDNKQIYDKYYSGRWLINGLRHKIDKVKYDTILDLTRDSVETAFP